MLSRTKRRVRSSGGRVLRRLKAARISLLSRLPVRLPGGGWWFACDDVVSRDLRLPVGFEAAEQKLLVAFLKPGMTVLDVGAHYGLYTLLASRKVGKKGRVIAFEPSAREMRMLERHIRINRCSNVRAEQFALGSREGVAELFLCLGRDTACNSLRPPAVSGPTERVQVPVRTLDAYLESSRVDCVDFVKLDVEGAELDVLKGATGLLRRRPRPAMMCELYEVRAGPWGYLCSDVYDLLEARGYRWFSITPEGRLIPCPRKQQFAENLFAVPEEKLALVEPFADADGS